MPIIINEVVSDIRINPPSGSPSTSSIKDSNNEQNHADRLLATLLREKARLIGRDQDDEQRTGQ